MVVASSLLNSPGSVSADPAEPLSLDTALAELERDYDKMKGLQAGYSKFCRLVNGSHYKESFSPVIPKRPQEDSQSVGYDSKDKGEGHNSGNMHGPLLGSASMPSNLNPSFQAAAGTVPWEQRSAASQASGFPTNAGSDSGNGTEAFRPVLHQLLEGLGSLRGAVQRYEAAVAELLGGNEVAAEAALRGMSPSAGAEEEGGIPGRSARASVSSAPRGGLLRSESTPSGQGLLLPPSSLSAHGKLLGHRGVVPATSIRSIPYRLYPSEGNGGSSSGNNLSVLAAASGKTRGYSPFTSPHGTHSEELPLSTAGEMQPRTSAYVRRRLAELHNTALHGPFLPAAAEGLDGLPSGGGRFIAAAIDTAQAAAPAATTGAAKPPLHAPPKRVMVQPRGRNSSAASDAPLTQPSRRSEQQLPGEVPPQ